MIYQILRCRRLPREFPSCLHVMPAWPCLTMFLLTILCTCNIRRHVFGTDQDGLLIAADREERRGQKLITPRRDGAEKWLLSGERVGGNEQENSFVGEMGEEGSLARSLRRRREKKNSPCSGHLARVNRKGWDIPGYLGRPRTMRDRVKGCSAFS